MGFGTRYSIHCELEDSYDNLKIVYDYVLATKGKITGFVAFHAHSLPENIHAQENIPVLELKRDNNVQVALCCSLLERLYTDSNIVYIVICSEPFVYRRLYATVCNYGETIFFVSKDVKMVNSTVTPLELKEKSQFLCSCCGKKVRCLSALLSKKTICESCMQFVDTSIFKSICKQKGK